MKLNSLRAAAWTLRCTAELDGFRAQLRDRREHPRLRVYQALLKAVGKLGPVMLKRLLRFSTSRRPA